MSDAAETRFSFATKKHEGFAGRTKSALSKFYLQRVKGFDVHQMCLSFIGYEGSEEHVNIQKRLVDDIVARHGGLCAGMGPGKIYDQKKFDTPYIRDFLLDRGALADVSETAAHDLAANHMLVARQRYTLVCIVIVLFITGIYIYQFYHPIRVARGRGCEQPRDGLAGHAQRRFERLGCIDQNVRAGRGMPLVIHEPFTPG